MVPECLNTIAPSWQSLLYGTKYEINNKGINGTAQKYNVLCAVCHVRKRSTVLMIQVKVS